MNGRNRTHWLAPLGALALAASLGIGTAAARQTPPADASADVYPVGIYEGSCDELAAQPSFALTPAALGPLAPQSLSGGLDDATPVAAEMSAQDDVVPVALSVTALDLNITELYAKDRHYVVAVSAPDAGPPVACGVIGGPLHQGVGQTRTTIDEASLLIGLGAANDAGYGGVAWIRSPRGGSTESTETTVTVFLVLPPGA